MSSLSSRLLVSVSLLLVFFFGATIVVLDTAFREAGEQAQEDILDTQLMALLAEAEPNEDGELEMPIDLREPRFGNLGSGLYGALFDESDEPVWTSRSSLGLAVSYGPRPAPAIEGAEPSCTVGTRQRGSQALYVRRGAKPRFIQRPAGSVSTPVVHLVRRRCADHVAVDLVRHARAAPAAPPDRIGDLRYRERPATGAFRRFSR